MGLLVSVCPLTARHNDLVLARGRGALAEAVLEAARHVAQVAHAPRALRAAALRLHAPVVLAHLRRRVAARGALLLLDVERGLAAAHTQAVRLAVVLTLRRRTLRHETYRAPTLEP